MAIKLFDNINDLNEFIISGNKDIHEIQYSIFVYYTDKKKEKDKIETDDWDMILKSLFCEGIIAIHQGSGMYTIGKSSFVDFMYTNYSDKTIRGFLNHIQSREDSRIDVDLIRALLREKGLEV